LLRFAGLATLFAKSETGFRGGVSSQVGYYLWRWGIEVNFRVEKAIIGTAEV